MVMEIWLDFLQSIPCELFLEILEEIAKIGVEVRKMRRVRVSRARKVKIY